MGGAIHFLKFPLEYTGEKEYHRNDYQPDGAVFLLGNLPSGILLPVNTDFHPALPSA